MSGSAATIIPIRQRTPEWLEFRADKITATDAAIIAGETGSLIELWAQKSRLVDPPEFDEATRELMDEGLAIQPYLLDYYRRKTEQRVRAINTMRQSREWPIAVSSPDGEVIGDRIGIEAKMTTSARWSHARDAGEPVPGDVFAQVQWQMFTAGWTKVDVVVLLFGRPKIIPIERDADYIEDLVALARRFHRWVLNEERPPVDGSENARRVLTALHPRNDGTMVPSTPDIDTIVRQWAALRADQKATEEQVGSIENSSTNS